jgi:hypothetical protein
MLTIVPLPFALADKTHASVSVAKIAKRNRCD